MDSDMNLTDHILDTDTHLTDDHPWIYENHIMTRRVVLVSIWWTTRGFWQASGRPPMVGVISICCTTQNILIILHVTCEVLVIIWWTTDGIWSTQRVLHCTFLVNTFSHITDEFLLIISIGQKYIHYVYGL